MSLPDRIQKSIAPSTRYLAVQEPLQLECGDALSDVQIAYQTWGDRRNADRSTVLICHALTGSADVDSWWPGIIGKDKAFDPDRDFVICSNILGSCYGTTGPLAQKPGTDEVYRSAFPRISVRDMVELQRILLDSLGIERVELVVGPSLGGMQALEWAATYPDRVGAIVPIGVGGRHSAWCIGISEAQRAAIAADPNWKQGLYSEDARPTQGLAAARMMAICTYRSWKSFDTRFGRDQRADGNYQIQSYLEHQGQKINDRFDANTYVTLTHAMHTHDLSRGRGDDYPNVLRSIRQPALVVSVSSDALYPPEEQELLARELPNARYEVLSSVHGHDGFLIETAALGNLIKGFRHQALAGGQETLS